METKIGVAIDAIVTALQTAQVPVVDGPITSGDYGNKVYIGYDADPSSEELAAEIDQEWAGIGTRKRDEEFEIICAAVVLFGDATSWKIPRDSVIALVDSVGVVLRADPSLGLTPPTVAQLRPGGYFQEDTPVGYQARMLFKIHVKTRV